MICPHCGAEVEGRIAVCPYCGGWLRPRRAIPAPPAQPKELIPPPLEAKPEAQPEPAVEEKGDEPGRRAVRLWKLGLLALALSLLLAIAGIGALAVHSGLKERRRLLEERQAPTRELRSAPSPEAGLLAAPWLGNLPPESSGRFYSSSE